MFSTFLRFTFPFILVWELCSFRACSIKYGVIYELFCLFIIFLCCSLAFLFLIYSHFSESTKTVLCASIWIAFFISRNSSFFFSIHQVYILLSISFNVTTFIFLNVIFNLKIRVTQKGSDKDGVGWRERDFPLLVHLPNGIRGSGLTCCTTARLQCSNYLTTGMTAINDDRY